MSEFTILYMVAVEILVVGIGIYAFINKSETKLQWLSDDIVKRVKTDYEIKIKDLEQKIDQYHISCKLEELCFIGVGGGGCNILEDIAQIDPWHTFIHINSDLQALQQKSSRKKILLGYDKKAGLGCGGQIECGAMMVDSASKKELYDLVDSFEKTYIIATLGGGVGSGATAQIIDYLYTLGKEVVVVAVLPFSFEGKKRNDVAQDALKEIQTINKDVIIIENDAVMQKCESDQLGTQKAFQYISKKIYQRIIDLSITP